VGIFDCIDTKPSPEQEEELEKWHEGIKAKAAAAIEAREERFKQAEREFEEMAQRGLAEKNDDVVGELVPLKIDKNDEEVKTIEVVSDHFSPEAVRQDFLPRETIPPPPMKQVVQEIHPDRPALPASAIHKQDPSLIALTVAIGELAKRIDALETNQELVANKTLNAVCNSLNEMLGLVRKEIAGISDKIVADVAPKILESIKPVLESLEQLKKDLEPRQAPDPEPVPESEPTPIPEPVQTQPKQASLGQACLGVFIGLVPYKSTDPDDVTVMELAYDRILKHCGYEKDAAVGEFVSILKTYNEKCLEYDDVRCPKGFYEHVKTTLSS